MIPRVEYPRLDLPIDPVHKDGSAVYGPFRQRLQTLFGTWVLIHVVPVPRDGLVQLGEKGYASASPTLLHVSMNNPRVDEQAGAHEEDKGEGIPEGGLDGAGSVSRPVGQIANRKSPIANL